VNTDATAMIVALARLVNARTVIAKKRNNAGYNTK